MDLDPQSDLKKELLRQEEGVDSAMECSRDETYYFEDGNIVLLVRDRLFRASPLCTLRYPGPDVQNVNLGLRYTEHYLNGAPCFLAHSSRSRREQTHRKGHQTTTRSFVKMPSKIFRHSVGPCTLGSVTFHFSAILGTQTTLSPPEIYAQTSPDTIDIPKLIAVAGVCHKYDIVALRDWALDVLGDYSLAHSDAFILKCRLWARVGRIFILAKLCKRDGLAQKIEADWMRRIANKQFLALEQALTSAEGRHELRKFHGKVYYTYLKATRITDSKAQNGDAIGINDVAKYADEAMTKLNEQRRSRLCQGLWSLMSLRPRLSQAPTLENNPECAVHSRECVVFWQDWWRGSISNLERKGQSLDDPVEIMEEVQKRLSKPLDYINLYGQYVRPPPCDVLIRTQARQMVDIFFDNLADRFMVP